MFRLSRIALLTLCVHPLFGGVVLDGSFGTHGALPGPNFMIQPNFGKQIGSNLFQSFSQFDLNSTQSATFLGPNTVHNILARVTDGDPSSIDGIVNSSIHGANLFFLNPAGVMFGQHAQINVSGSFAVSTANYLKLADGGKFNTSLGGGDVLTSAPVSAFGFLNSVPAPISVTGSALNVAAQKSFSLVAGDITMSGGTITRDPMSHGPGSRVNLVSVRSPGEVVLDATNINSTVDVTQFTTMGDISLTNLAKIDTSGPGGGPVVVRGGNLYLNDSQIFSETTGSIQGGAIDIDLLDNLQIVNLGSIVADTVGEGKGGNLSIRADSLSIRGTAAPFSFTGIAATSKAGAVGDAGDLTLAVDHSLSIVAGGQISTNTFSSGNGGNLNIHAGSISMDSTADTPNNLTGILSRSEVGATGNAGDVMITVGGAVSIVRGSEISAATFTSGQGGDITIHAGSLSIDNSATPDLFTGISAAATQGKGKAGDLSLMVAGALRMVGHGQIFDGSLRTSTGNGGNLSIDAGSLSIDDTGTDVGLVDPTRRVDISAETRGTGNAGNMNITVDGALSIVGSGEIAVSTVSFRSDRPHDPPKSISSGHAGNLSIHSGSLLIEGSATPSKATLGVFTGIAAISDADGKDNASNTTDTAGNAGNVTINVDHAMSILGGGQISATTFSSGHGGDITIHAESLSMNSLADIPGNLTGVVSRSEGSATGDAGDVTITVDQAMSIVSGSEISAATFTKGLGGDITIHAGSLLIDNSLTDGSVTPLPTLKNIGPFDLFTGISAAATQGKGKAGDLSLMVAGALRMVGHGQIFDGSLRTSTGNGGNLSIDAGSLSIDDTGTDVGLVDPTRRVDISAETRGTGNAGNMNITVDGALSIVGSGEIAVSTVSFRSDRPHDPPKSISSGSAGNLSIHAGSLLIDGTAAPGAFTGISAFTQTDGADRVSKTTDKSGNAGNLNITITGDVKMNGGSIASSSTLKPGSVGPPSGTFGAAGSVTLVSDGTIRLVDNSSVSVFGLVNGGDITIKAPVLVSLIDSDINATAGSVLLKIGVGGNITIDPIALRLRNSTISASAGAQGGHISLFTSFLDGPVEAVAQDGAISLAFSSSISATGGTSNGTVNITAPALDLGAELITLPSSLLSAESQLQERCTALLQGDFSSFISIGRGGTEPAPEELQITF